MQGNFSLSAQNATEGPWRIPSEAWAKGSLQFLTGTGTIGFEVSNDGNTWGLLEITKSEASATKATTLTAAGLGYADMPFTWVRVKKTDAGGTAVTFSVTINIINNNT